MNISFRSLHLGVSGVLVGGQVFDVPCEQLLLGLVLTIATGIALVPRELPWWDSNRGRVGGGDIGSHMPARYRYYSWMERSLPSYPHGGPSTQNEGITGA